MKGLRRCHDAPCIVNDGRPTFPSFLFLSRNAAFVVFAMLKHRSFQSMMISGLRLFSDQGLLALMTVNCNAKLPFLK